MKQMVKLNEEQSTAVSYIHDQSEDKRPVVLNGVTGSGKTEVYIEIIKTYSKDLDRPFCWHLKLP